MVQGIGRLKRTVTIDAARANLAAVQAQLGRDYPDSDATIGVSLQPLKETTIGGVRRSLWLVYGAVSVLLLITCTNIAALLLSRAAHRQQEISVRLSLGASQLTVAAQMLTETLVLSLAGALVGLGIAFALVTAFRAAAPDLPRIEEVALDARILVYTLGSTLLVAVLCGMLPALRASRDRLLGAGSASRSQVSLHTGVQWALVGTQVALSVTLLAGAGLLVKSLRELSRVDPGFNTSQILTFRISGNYGETVAYRSIDRAHRSQPRAAQRAARRRIGCYDAVPPWSANRYERPFSLAEAQSEADRRLLAEHRIVSPSYFATLQIPIVEGSRCEQQPFGAPQALMVNRSFVTRYLSGRPTPIGLLLTNDNANNPPARIIGVVADAHERGLDRAPGPTVYSCFNAPNPTPNSCSDARRSATARAGRAARDQADRAASIRL